MRIRLFPCDLEGSGCYRLVYPYGFIASNTEHETMMEAQKSEGAVLLPIPPGMIGFADDAKADLDVELFMSDDVYVFQRPMENVYPGVLLKLVQAGKKVVVDMDDFMHGGLPSSPGKSVKGNKRSSVEALTLCLRMASMVTVSTDSLAEFYSRYNPNVVVIRNRLRNKDFANITPSYEKDRPLRIGWMGLVDYRMNDLSLIKPWLNRFLKAHPEVTFVNVGSKAALDYLCVPKGRRMHFDRREFPKHFEPTSEIDIGLVPLTRNRFNECKSSLKGMEYGAVGAAVVASPTHEYERWVDEAWNGGLCHKASDWEDWLEWMVSDDNWRRCGEENRRKAMDNLIDNHWGEWLQALEARCLQPS